MDIPGIDVVQWDINTRRQCGPKGKQEGVEETSEAREGNKKVLDE